MPTESEAEAEPEDSAAPKDEWRIGPDAARWKRSLGFIMEYVGRITAADSFRLSAAITYYVILSIFPAALIFAGLLAFLPAETAESAQVAVTDTLDSIFGSSADTLVGSIDKLFNQASGTLLTFGTLLALWTTSSAMHMLIVAVDRVYRPGRERRWLQGRALGVVLALGSIVALAVVITFVVVLPAVDIPGVSNLVGLVIAFLVIATGALVLFQVSPPQRSRWLADVPGAATAALLVVVFTLGFRLYMRIAAQLGSVTVTISGGIVVLLWIYLMALAQLFGAALNDVLWQHGFIRPLHGPPEHDDRHRRAQLPPDERRVYTPPEFVESLADRD